MRLVRKRFTLIMLFLLSLFFGITNLPTPTTKVYASPDPDSVTRSASGYENNVGWKNPTLAYASDNQYAETLLGTNLITYKGFDFQNQVPYGYVITDVIGILEHYDTDSYWKSVDVSGDAGATFVRAATFYTKPIEETSEFSLYPNDFWTWTRNTLSDANFRVKVKCEATGGCYPNKTYSLISQNGTWYLKNIEKLSAGDPIIAWQPQTGFYETTISTVDVHTDASEWNSTIYIIQSGELNFTVRVKGQPLDICWKSYTHLTGNHPVWCWSDDKGWRKESVIDLKTRFDNASIPTDYLEHVWWGRTLKKFPIENITSYFYEGAVYNIRTSDPKDRKFIKYLSDEDYAFIMQFADQIDIELILDPVYQKDTGYIDHVSVRVEYELDTYGIDNDVTSGLDLYDKDNSDMKPDSKLTAPNYPKYGYAEDKWYDESWYFILGNSTGTGDITSAEATFYRIFASVNPNSDTFALQINVEDAEPPFGFGETWHTLWSGTELWTDYDTNKTYDVSAYVDTWDKVNKTRFRITSTAKSGGEDSVTWSVDAVYLLVSTTVEYTVTFYFYVGGSLLVNGTNTNNETSTDYEENTVLNLTAVPNYQYCFKNHTYDASSTTNNPFYLTVTQDYTTKTYFRFGYDCNYIGMNNTVAGEGTLFSSNWLDLYNAEGLSHFLFSTNNTGAWANASWSNSWIDTTWAESTATLNSTVDIVIAFRFYANDTSGDEYVSTICFLSTKEADYPSAGYLLVIITLVCILPIAGAIFYVYRRR